jgi:hypothetical protein
MRIGAAHSDEKSPLYSQPRKWKSSVERRADAGRTIN